jgi:hypothetical protein
MFAGLRRIAWLAAGIATLAVSLIMMPTTASAAPQGYGHIEVKTTDRRPGGYAKVDLTWSGRGLYSGHISGVVQDVEKDGFCVMAYAWEGSGPPVPLNLLACPAASATDTRGINHSFTKKRGVWVRVCLVGKKGDLHYCSRWY